MDRTYDAAGAKKKAWTVRPKEVVPSAFRRPRVGAYDVPMSLARARTPASAPRATILAVKVNVHTVRVEVPRRQSTGRGLRPARMPSRAKG